MCTHVLMMTQSHRRGKTRIVVTGVAKSVKLAGVRACATSIAGRCMAVGVVSAAIFACFAPTQLLLRLRTNLQSRTPQTAMQIGPSESAFKAGAEPDGRIGDLVVVPSGDRDALVEVRIALGVDGVDANTCFTTPENPRCVTAKRSYRFAPHETRTFDVFLSSTCLGVPCGPGLSCNAVTGACVRVEENESDPTPPPVPPPPPDGGPLDAGTGSCGPSVATSIGTPPRTLVASGNYLYWLGDGDTIKRRPKDAAAPVEDVSMATHLTATSTHLFWSRGQLLTFQEANASGPTLACATSDTPNAILLRPGAAPGAPPLGVYLAGATSLSRAAAGACAFDPRMTAPPIQRMAIADRFVYVTAGGALGVVSTTFSASSEYAAIPGFTGVTLLASNQADAAVAAIATNEGADLHRLGAASDVPSLARIASRPNVEVTGLAADATFAYWLERPRTGPANRPARLYRLPLTATVAVPAVAYEKLGAIDAESLVADGDCLYTWASAGNAVSRQGSAIGIAKTP